MSRRLHPICLAVLALTAACNHNDASDTPDNATPRYAAEIRRTEFGIPHIKADDEGGLGFGVGYAYAQDNFCMLAEQIVTVNGQRSKYFGPDASGDNAELTNLQTDFFYALINDTSAVDSAWRAQPEAMKSMIAGYVAGYNLYLDGAANHALPKECKDAAWVRKASVADFIKLVRSYAIEAGAGEFIGAMVAAAPPGLVNAAPAANRLKALDPAYWTHKRERNGSNGVALGKDATDNGAGMLLGNPHFPWEGRLRFYQLHLTIPGKLDVMGASLGGLPQVNIGFNRDLAWTHTVNTSSHFTLHALQLDPADPTRYLIDGQARDMTRKTVTIDVRDADGVVRQRSHNFYGSQFGYVVASDDMVPWTRATAFALFDPNLENHRMLEQWHAMSRATSVEELKSAVDRIVGLPWVNTIAADKQGNTLYMDVSVVPRVSQAQQDQCVPEPFKPLAGYGIVVLDGSHKACAPSDDSSAPQPGIYAGASLPRLTRSDYVQNSNDSAWLSNPQAPLIGFPSIVSTEGAMLQGRTRIGISQLQRRLAGADGMPGKLMTVPQLQSLALSNNVFYADLMIDDVLRACAGSSGLTATCAALASWDRSANLNANMGYAYFAGMWKRIAQMPNVWAVPFNPADPVGTPRGLNLGDPAVAEAVRSALGAATQDLADLGVPAGARWGDLQGVMRGDTWIPVHGGDGEMGVYNAIDSAPDKDGRLHVHFGTSYLQTVWFDTAGVHAQAMLSYSQSTDPASPYYGDQTARFSRKEWITQVFSEAQIKADPAYKSISISAPRQAAPM